MILSIPFVINSKLQQQSLCISTIKPLKNAFQTVGYKSKVGKLQTNRRVILSVVLSAADPNKTIAGGNCSTTNAAQRSGVKSKDLHISGCVICGIPASRSFGVLRLLRMTFPPGLI